MSLRFITIYSVEIKRKICYPLERIRHEEEVSQHLGYR